MAHRIVEADRNSPGYLHGMRAGDEILQINGEDVIDEIDYQALTSGRHVDVLLRRPDGREEHIRFVKEEWEPLGLRMSETMMCRPMLCRNKCVFCFVDQMRPHMRDTLYVRDDDWRMSLMMGNYITLTNIGEHEFERLLRRRPPHVSKMPGLKFDLRNAFLPQRVSQDKAVLCAVIL